MWQFMKRGIVVAAGLVMAMSFLGDLHGLGDSLAVFRTAILLGCGGVDSVALALMVAYVLIGGLQFTDGRFREASAGTDFVLYQKNLLYFERDRTAFVADVLASGG